MAVLKAVNVFKGLIFVHVKLNYSKGVINIIW